MRVGINLLGEAKLKSGTGRYAYEVISNLLGLDSKNEYLIFVSKPARKEFEFKAPNVSYIQINVPGNNMFLRRILEQLLLPILVLLKKVSVVYSTNNISPVLLGSKNVLTIHDLARWKVAGTAGKVSQQFLKLLLSLSAKVARSILTISDATKSDLIEILNVPAAKIVVAYNSINNEVFIKQDESKINASREKYKIDKDYIFIHATIEARKNHLRLIEAYKKSAIPAQLVIIGKDGLGSAEVHEFIKNENLEEKVKVLGFMNDGELVSLLSGAKFFVFPTLFEGAGLPPLEAMACGVSVLTSDIPVIREYCGDAAYFVDPYDINSISDGLKNMYFDSKLRENLIAQGFENIKKFSWKAHSETLLQLLTKHAQST